MSTLIYDFQNFLMQGLGRYSLGSSTQLTTSKGELSGHIFGCLSMMLTDLRMFGPSRLVFVMDRTPTRKLELYPLYKGNRARDDDGNRVYAFDMPTVRNQLLEVLRCLPCEIASAEGEEADDVIATLVKHRGYSAPAVIVTSDSDMTQLVGDGFQVWNRPKRIRFKTAADVYAHCELYPHQVALWKSIIGEPGDGVPPIGANDSSLEVVCGACRFLSSCQKKYGSEAVTPSTPGCEDYKYAFKTLSEAINKAWPSSGRLGAMINAMKGSFLEAYIPQLKRNWALIALESNLTNVQYERPTGNMEELKKLVERWECKSLLQDDRLAPLFGVKDDSGSRPLFQLG